MAFSGLLAPWATGVEPAEPTDPVETLTAAVEDSVTTVTTANGEVVEAAVVEPAEEPAAPDAPSEEPEEPQTESGEPAEEVAEEPAADEAIEISAPEPEEAAPADPVSQARVEAPATQERTTEVFASDLGSDDFTFMPLASNTSSGIVINTRTVAMPLGTSGNIGTNHTNTVGATFRLYNGTSSSPTTVVNQPWASCTVTSNGTCTIEVPNTNSGGANRGNQYWVVQDAPAIGTYMNPELRIGSFSGPTTPFRYQFRTPALVSNTDYQIPGTGGNDAQRSFGAFPNSLTNPFLEPECQAGIDIALVMDLSESLSNAQRTAFRNAIVSDDGLFDALTGTNSRAAIFTFGNNSPAGGTSNHPDLLSIDNQRSALNNRVVTSTNSTQRTNWDRGLRAVAQSSVTYDLVLFVTDGAPNVIAPTSGNSYASPNGDNVAVRSLEAAIYSANAVKAKGSRVVAVGVGNGVGGQVALNLRAVSGTTANSDYYQTSSWDDLNSELERIAQAATCRVPVQLNKRVVDLNGQDPTAEAGWAMTVQPGTPTGGSISSDPAAVTQQTNAVGAANWVLSFTDKNASANVTVSENAASKPNYEFAAGSCVITSNGTSTTVPLASASHTLTGVKPGDSISCTFTNRPVPTSLTVDKTWVINGEEYNHADAGTVLNQYGASAAPVVSPVPSGQTAAFGATLSPYSIGASVNVNEQMNAGQQCRIESQQVSVKGGAFAPVTSAGVNVTLSQGDNNVTFKNELTCGASLTLIKDVKNDHGGQATAADWTLSGLNGSAGPNGVASGTTTAVLPGTYTLSESAGPANYHWTSLECVKDGASIDGVGKSAPAVGIAIGDHVTCTFTNQDIPPTLTLVKEISGAADSYKQYWDLTAAGMLGDDPFSFTGQSGVTSAVPSNVPLTLSEAINNPDLAGEFVNGVAWVCEDAAGGDVNLVDGTLVTVGFGQDVTCTIVNTLQAANPTIAKTAGTAQQEADGTWTIPFTVTVTNPSLVADVTYTLDDDLGFDTELQINSQSATGPDGAIAGWNGSVPLATDVTLAAASSHDYTITVNVTVPTTVTYDDVTCVGNESGSGAYNSATLTVGDNTWTDDACADIPLAELDITKTVASVEQNADGTWTVTYDVVVTNLDDDVDTTYDLTDTLDFEASFTVDSAEWGHVEGDMELRAGTWNLPNQTATLATAEIIGRGAAHTYTVTAVVSVAAGAGVPQDVECGPNGGGFLNSAEVTFPGGVAEDEDCASPAFPTITKTIGDPAQDLSNGSWNVTYTVTVTGDADQDLFYNLSDTPDLGDGLVVNTMTATGPDGAIVGWNGGLLATSKELPAGTDHVYTIVVNVSVPTTIEHTDLECAVQGDENGTGLFNSATLTVSNRTFTDTACGDLPRPEVEVEKNLGAVNQTANGDWAITYEVVVTNNSDFSTRYDLVDTLDFGGGLTPSAASWASVEFPAIIGVWDLEAGPATNIATNMAIAAGATHTYNVTVRADVAAGTELPTGALCEAGQDGSGGFLNVVVLTFPGGTDTDDACGAPSVPTVSKTFTGAATQGSDGLWTVGYQLRATNNTTDQTQYYSLTDTPAFADGVQIVSWRVVAASGTPAGTPADWAPYNPAANTIITDQELAPDTTHEWLVEFRLRINPGAVAPTDMECNEAGAGHGLFNTVNLTSGEQTRADDACGNIEEVGVPTLEKTVASVVQGADGLWTITYDVVVTANPDFVTTYDLTDTLRFGAGVVINEATWQWLEDPAAPAPTAWDLDEGLTTTMATDRLLAAGTDTHTYRVVVVAAVTQDLIGTPALDCELGDGEEGTGFRNDATLTSGEHSVTDDACASPSLPTITKTADPTVSQTDDGDWLVSYDIVVTGGQHASIYDLADDPAFAAGVSINNWSVTATGTTSPGISEAAWTDGVIATGVELAAGAVHTWTVTFNVSIAPSVAPVAAECDPATGGGAGLFNEATLTIGDTELSDDDCVDIPEQQQPTVAKTLGKVEQNVEGYWIVEYTVVVTGAEDQTTRYDLTDTLAFGGGATINSAAWESADAPVSSGAWNSPNTDRTTTLATDSVLAAGATHTYDITVVVDLAAGTIGSAAMDCVITEGEEGTGFLNEVDLYVGDELVDSDDACGTPAKPNFVKTAVGLTNNNDGTFDAVYTLTVTGNAAAGQRLVYDITDTPVVPAGVTVEEMTVAGVSLPINPDWSLTDPVVAANVVLEQGATHVYTVTLRIRITEPIAPELRECDAVPGTESGGLLNTGEVTSGNDEYPGEDCIDIPDPDLDVTKTLGTVNQQADGTWRVTYVVTVTNSAWVPGSYDLTDTIAFGGGITPLTAEWSLAGTTTSGAWDDLPDTTTATLATDHTIGARGLHQYDVVVTADVAAGVIGSVAGECNEQGGSDGGGFLNSVELTWSGGTEDDSACGEPALPTITKTVDEQVVQDIGDASWIVSYDLVVTNPSTDSDLYYSLDDAPAFADGVTIEQWRVLPGDWATWSGTSGAIVSDELIEAGEVHTYTVEFRVRISANIDADIVECDPSTGEGSGLFNTALLTSGNDEVTDDDCIEIPGQQTPTVEKLLGTVTQGTDGRWTVTYSVVVTGAEDQATRYDLSDTLRFGGGATVISADWTWDDFDGITPPTASGTWADPMAEPSTVMAAQRVLRAGETDTYTVTVVVDVATGTIDSAAMDCQLAEGEDGTGFLNAVNLYVGDELVDSDDACGIPAKPTLVKTAVGLTDNSDGTFDAVYTLTVTSSAAAGQTVVYDLADTPVIPAEVDVVSRTVTGPGLDSDAAWNDGEDDEIISGVTLVQGASHVYTVTLKVRVTEPMTPEQRECDATPGTESGGLLNTGEVTSGNDGYEAEDCIEIPDPEFGIDKSVASVGQNLDGSWTVAYEVTVVNTSWLPGTYNLTDTLAFGGGLIPASAAWALQGTDISGTWTDPATEATATLATDRALGARGAHVYTVTVTADVEGGWELPATAVCTGDDGLGGGGFLNTAEVTFPGGSDDAAACEEPTIPEIGKTFGTVTQTADASWDVTYVLTVDNTDGHATFYDLTDTPAFADGVTINGWTVTSGADTPDLAIDGAWTDGVIVTGLALPADGVHTYTVTFNVDIAVSISAEVLECSTTEVREGHGFFNEATMAVGENSTSDDDCGEIPEPGIPSLTKTLGTVEQTPEGLWQVTYVVTVTGDAELITRYSLVDELQFGGDAEVREATWTWDDAPEGAAPADASGTWADPQADAIAVLATERVLAAGETDSYTVTVLADVAAGTIGSAGMVCEQVNGSTEGRGFLNGAELWVGEDFVEYAEDCGEPAGASFSKTGLDLTANGDGSFTAVYELRVTSDATDGQVVAYDLTDTPVLPDGVELVSRSVTSDDATPNPTWADGLTDVMAIGQQIAQDEEHVYTVTLEVMVARPLTPAERLCEADDEATGGLLNTGLLVSGNDEYSDEDCFELPDPEITITKVVDHSIQTSPGVFEVTYTLTVENVSDVPGAYDLTDNLRYGDGATPTTGTWEREGGPTGEFDMTESTSAQLATDEVLAARGSHVYTVVIIATVDVDNIETVVGDCEVTETSSGSGFLNEATLAFEHSEVNDEACVVIDLDTGALEITKQLAGATSQFTGGNERMFQMQWSCTAPSGDTFSGTLDVAAGESRIASDDLPLGSVCTVVETAPSGGLANNHTWGEISYSAASVTLTEADRNQEITVTNTIDEPRRPLLPGAGADMAGLVASSGAALLLAMIVALGLAARRARRGQAQG